ncbi:DUF2332 family protein [Novosphingobium sp.]|uniref:DUF2332 domain-containing protein n=1 Tax=Novosphingobium sp. TaxID=1874826 RepID=UPI002616538D|nr:DUF2332 family protein [Novosphingobium sp.]
MQTTALGALPLTRLRPALRGEAQLLLEAAKAQRFGKHFVAALLESLARTLWQAPALVRVIEEWPGDLASAGVIFRLNAGLHAIARSGRFPDLQALYTAAETATIPDPLQLDAALAVVLHDAEDDLLLWLTGPTQTNEVARIAGLAAALMELSAAREMPCSLLELGASAGLNLNLAHYDLRIGSLHAGDGASDVVIAPQWSGRTPRPGRLAIVLAEGVDLSPLDVARPGDAERLQAYIWPGERERSERLRAAIALARRHPPRVEQGSAGLWLARQLAAPQATGQRRVVFHSMVLQYLPEAERLSIERLLSAAGARAEADRPLVRVGLEWNEGRSAVEVRVTEWDGSPRSGRPRLAARCHPYAEWFEWFGLED